MTPVGGRYRMCELSESNEKCNPVISLMTKRYRIYPIWLITTLGLFGSVDSWCFFDSKRVVFLHLGMRSASPPPGRCCSQTTVAGCDLRRVFSLRFVLTFRGKQTPHLIEIYQFGVLR